MVRLAHRIILTEQCNRACSHCFNADVRTQKEMDVDTLFEFWGKNAIKINKQSLKIMGGEPTLHPRLHEVIEKGKLYYDLVVVFTNGSNNDQLGDEEVRHVVNGHTYKVGDKLPNMTLHFVIRDYDYSKITESFKAVPEATFVLSPDTQVDLWEYDSLWGYREMWVDALKTLVPIMKRRGLRWHLDHCLPMCFYTQEMINELQQYGLGEIFVQNTFCCSEGYLGLIATNFDLYFCNQTRIKLGSILNEDGTPKYIGEIEDIIRTAPAMKTLAVEGLSKKCGEYCTVLPLCKAGCYYNVLESRNGR